MAYVTEEDDDDNPYTRDGILKPGRTARVPLIRPTRRHGHMLKASDESN